MVQNGTVSEEKTEAATRFSKMLTILEILSPTPIYVKLLKQYRLVITKRYRFGSLTIFFTPIFLRSEWQFTGQRLLEVETYTCRG